MGKRERIIEDIQKLEKEHGYISHDKYVELGNFPINKVIKEFGKWSKAKEEAGLDVHIGYISKEELLEDIKKCSEEVDYLSKRKYDDIGKCSISTVRNKFENWTEAKKKAGLEVKSSSISKEELKEDIRKTFEEMDGNRITLNEYEKYGKYSIGPISNYGWNDLLEELDIDTYDPVSKIPREEIIDRLKDMEPVGVGNISNRFNESDDINKKTVENRFNSVRDALKEAGVWVTKEESLELIYEVIKEMDDGYHKIGNFKEEIKEKTGFSITNTGISTNDIEEYCEDKDVRISFNGSRTRIYVETQNRYENKDKYDQYLIDKFNNFNDLFDISTEDFETFKEYIGKGYSPSGIFAALIYIENEDMTQSEISEKLDVSEVTLRKLHEKIEKEKN